MTRMKKSTTVAPAIASAAEHRREITRRIEQLSYRHNRWTVFSDFVELAAISISNAVDLAERAAREQRYAEIAKRYEPDEMALFPEMFAALVDALEGGFDDVLGRVFHDLELHNKYQGQFFTPYALCRVMAQVTLGDRESIARIIADRGYFTALEPACGGGAMSIAAAEAMKDAGINYQRQLHVTAVDVDLKCVHMAYLQLALLHVPAVVIHGNSLTLEKHSEWRTPAHVLGGWSWRLRRAAEPTGTGDGQLSLLENVA